MIKNLEKKMAKGFINMNNLTLLYNQNTRNIKLIQQLDVNLINIDKFKDFKDIDFSTSQEIIDLSVLPTKNKLQLFEHISNEKRVTDFTTDLSFNYLDDINLKKYKINAVTAFNFYSPKSIYLYFGSSESIKKIVNELDLKVLTTSNIKDIIVYPITISTIINEAYLSLEENLASKEDIDTAMMFGLNYPLGPFEWSKEIGCSNIFNLLTEYYQKTKNKRYFSSTLLVEE